MAYIYAQCANFLIISRRVPPASRLPAKYAVQTAAEDPFSLAVATRSSSTPTKVMFTATSLDSNAVIATSSVAETFNSTTNSKSNTTGGRTTYNCLNCGRKYQAKPSLRRHMRTECNQPKRFVCRICHRAFHHNFKLTNHYRRLHTNKWESYISNKTSAMKKTEGFHFLSFFFLKKLSSITKWELWTSSFRWIISWIKNILKFWELKKNLYLYWNFNWYRE